MAVGDITRSDVLEADVAVGVSEEELSNGSGPSSNGSGDSAGRSTGGGGELVGTS